MQADLAKKILDAIAADDPKAALEVLREIAASLIGGAADASDAPAEPTAATADAPQPDPNEPPAAQTRDTDADKLEALTRDIADLRARNAELDLDSRRELIAELVRVGAETPATAWQRDAKGNATDKPVSRLAGEPLREMRDRIAILRKAAPRRLAPPAAGDDVRVLSPRVQTAVERMTPEQRAKFERYQESLSANRKGPQ